MTIASCPDSLNGTRPAGPDAAMRAYLALSDQCDMLRSRVLELERQLLEAGHVWEQGYLAAERVIVTGMREIIFPVAHPEEDAARRIKAATAVARAEAVEHERSFVARSYNTRSADRTGAQQATITIYPPPPSGSDARGRSAE